MKKIIFTSIFLGLLSVADVLPATDFVIENGQTVTTTQVLSDPGDQGLIEQGGTINVTGSNVDGVKMENENQKVTNKGVIQTSDGDGIVSNAGANNSKVENYGSIQTTNVGFTGAGIRNLAMDFSAVNSGFITTQGTSSYGMYNVQGDNVIFTNTGFISTQGQNGIGIHNVNGENFVVDNSGTIETQGLNAHGILGNSGNNSRITNSGLIHTLEDNSVGIYI